MLGRQSCGSQVAKLETQRVGQMAFCHCFAEMLTQRSECYVPASLSGIPLQEEVEWEFQRR